MLTDIVLLLGAVGAWFIVLAIAGAALDRVAVRLWQWWQDPAD